MGFGVYLVWPAFYTDVTDSYRLGRGGRVRTDLGGLYFNAIVAVAITGLWWWLRYDALLLVVATQILQMLRQLAPMVRFDGYHVLADLTGVPDLYSRIKPTLLGMLPWRWGDPQARLLKPWARIVVTLWVLIVIPLLLSALATAVIALPRLMGTAWASLHEQQDVLLSAWADGDMIQATARVLAMIAIVIPVAGVVYMMVRLVRRSVAGAYRGTAGKPLMRIMAAAAGVAVAGAVAYAWLPRDGNYRPIQPWERGTIGDIVYALRSDPMRAAPQRSDSPGLASARKLINGQQGVMRALWDNGAPLPTKSSPRLALVLVPKAGAGGGGGGFTAPAAAVDDGWVFPVDRPLAPGPGDTQALAVNTTDDTTVYEAAFAMVWVTDDTDAMNVNEAQAYASCNDCAAVAVAYQVVFVVDGDDTDDNVVAPQNLAGALNYDCVNCLTYALARQVFITVDEPLSDEAMAKLDALWAEIAAYEDKIEAGEVPPDEIGPQLDAYTEQIKAIVEADQPGTIPSTSDASDTSTVGSPTVSVSPTATPTPSSTAATASPAPTEPTMAPTAQIETSSAPTTSAQSTSSAPPAPSSPAPTGTAPTGTPSGDTTSGGSTSGGTASSGSGTSP
jgi:putative peptide zinc metalloprotease protein